MVWQKSKAKTLKKQRADVRMKVDHYKDQMFDQIERDLNDILFPTYSGNPEGPSVTSRKGVFDGIGDWETAEGVQKEVVQRAVSNGRLNPQAYLEQVRGDLPEGHYREEVLEKVTEKLTRHYLLIPVNETAPL